MRRRALSLVMGFFLFAAGQAYGQTMSDPVTNMELVPVKSGCFQMGDTYGDRRPVEDKDEVPVHEVCVSDFYMGKYAVTVAQFRRFVDDTAYKTDAERNSGGLSGCWSHESSITNSSYFEWVASTNWKKPNKSQGNEDDHPVSCISWNDAKAFTEWLARKTGKPYRLPTEAEWEYAARAGTQTRNYWGNNINDACQYSNVADNTTRKLGSWLDKRYHFWKEKHDCTDGYFFVAPVGRFKPNAFGLYDMMGNVWQWCEDWFDAEYYKSSPRNDPTGPSVGEKRVNRGGSWNDQPQGVRASTRGTGVPVRRYASIGFRVVLPGR